MAANTSAIFPKEGVIGQVSLISGVAAALTSRTVAGVAGLTSLVPANTNGTRVDSIKVISAAPIGTANSANIVRIWSYLGSGNAVLIDEISVTAATPSASSPGFATTISYNTATFQLVTAPSTGALYCSIHTIAGTQDNMNIIAFGGVY